MRVLLDQPGVRQDEELLSWLGEARYHYDLGDYSGALPCLRWCLRRMPALEPLIFHYVAVCERVLAIPTTEAERQYAERHARFVALPRWLRWTMRSHSWRVRCKYCGRYTPYIDPNVPTNGGPLGNICSHCSRSYPMPSWMWDSPEGRLYSYYRMSFHEDAFYDEFERDYDPQPPCDRRPIIPEPGAIEVEGVVSAKLPDMQLQVRLPSGHEVLVDASGRAPVGITQIVVGDRVRVQMPPYDLTRGRITWVQHPKPDRGEPAACPYCGWPLRSPLAKQCQHCRRDWHDPQRLRWLGEVGDRA